MDGWRLHYANLKILFKEVEGFEEFMIVLADNLLRDIYVVSTYYKSPWLIPQANALLTMICSNIILQLVLVRRPSERAVRTPVGATPQHFRIARFAIGRHIASRSDALFVLKRSVLL